ncbi:trp operon repressor [Desulfococcaceae bacterium OttesenSCG-928-F15]|nr:trp operon repressor [Desulfococcaceae bacterium OttesenSCG-928-F15]
MTEAWKDLIRILAGVTDLSQMEKFLGEMLTEKEISDLTLRWQLLKELQAGEPQRKIAARHGISLCKITRGSRILRAEDSVCASILKKEPEQTIPKPKGKKHDR